MEAKPDVSGEGTHCTSCGSAEIFPGADRNNGTGAGSMVLDEGGNCDLLVVVGMA